MTRLEELHFDEAEHRYWLGDRELPSVHRVMQDAGLFDDTWWTEQGRRNGQFIHAACELHDRGELDESRLPADKRPYLVAWMRFVEDNAFRIIEIERPVHDPCGFGYAGTPDRVILRNEGHEHWIIEIKRGAKVPAYGVQTAAYAWAHNACRPPEIDPVAFYRAAVYLGETGTYHLEEHTLAQDYEVWFAALKLYYWRYKYVRRARHHGPLS